MRPQTDAQELINHLKSAGFVYQDSEIYGGMANAWDYGPPGVLLKGNLVNLWTERFARQRDNVVLLDSAIIQHPRVWKASGHLAGFSDPLVDCRKCKRRFRADKLVGDGSLTERSSAAEVNERLAGGAVPCPECGGTAWTPSRAFNLMFETAVGPTRDEASLAYLRPETAQGIFANFKNVQRTQRLKLPFAVAQVGKAFRNEITPGNFVFRTREFEQMEIEHFCRPGTSQAVFDEYATAIDRFLTEDLGLDRRLLHRRDHEKAELAHYSKATTDFEFDFPHGRGELWGLADRGDFDLRSHQEESKADLTYLDDDGTRFLPEVVEPSVGVGRLWYAVLASAYEKERLPDGEERVVLRLKPALAPYTCAVLPLVNKLNARAKEVFAELRARVGAWLAFDAAGSIGKRYRRQDALGTPACVTVDFQTLEDGTVTLRDRDAMTQRRVALADLPALIGALKAR